ncbi:transcriptional regulator [Mesorhizobium sp. WSM3859]|nr:transcriptional regulator [Mesorhizobium sp. WSM3859]
MRPDIEPSESQNATMAARIREELARRRMSRQMLADIAKISISTLEKALNGSRPFTVASVVRLEAALGVSLRDRVPKVSTSRSDLGGYAKAGVAWLEGDYLTLRPSFEVAGAIYAYRTQIHWDEAQECLAFREMDRLDAPFSQKGVVSIPSKSGQIYLYTNDQGQMRVAILNRPHIRGEIYGLLATLAVGAGSNLTPVAAPIALLPWPGIGNPKLGRIQQGDAEYQDCRKHLTMIVDAGYAKLLT